MSSQGALLTSVVPRQSSGLPSPAVRAVLEFVCIADIGLGLLIIFLPQTLFSLFNLPPTDELLWFRLIGFMLIPTACDGLVGFRAPVRYQSNVFVSCASRFVTGGFLLFVASSHAVPWILIVLGAGEVIVGFLTAYYVLHLPRRDDDRQ